MAQWLSAWFGQKGFLPHGYCISWSPELLWTMVAGDAGIAVAYFAIPALMVYFMRKRGVTMYNHVAWLFAVFIVSCGVTHVLGVWTIWQPIYGVEALVKVFTALVSLVTAAAMWPLIPRALSMPTVGQLQEAVAKLSDEVETRRRAERDLAQTQETLAATLASIGAGIIETDALGRIIRMNRMAEEVTGWSIAEASGRDFWEVWQREGMPDYYKEQNIVELALKESVTVNRVYRINVISKTGKRTPAEVRFQPVYAGGVHPAGLVLVFRDMSALDHGELAAQQLVAIVNSSSDAIIGKTLDGHILSWNAGAEKLFGYTGREAIGRSVKMLIPDDRLDEEDRILADLARGIHVPAFKTLRKRKDGSLVDVSVTISPVRDAKGRIVGASKIARDITHEVRHERMRLDAIRLEAENRQMEEANRLKSQFLANMSHELRTPLNAIIGFADILRLGHVTSDSPKFKEFIGHISTSGRHLLQLINDVLDLSKIESGKFEFFAEHIEPPRVIEEVLAILHTEASRKHLALSGHADPSLTDIEIDVGRLKQVLYNYLSNAIKFTPKGGNVQVRFLPEGSDWFRVEVEDTGIGISEKDVSRLFSQFVQVDAGLTKRYEGTGLGLALTRSLVEAQGGTVGVRSTPGVGSVFHAILPRRPVQQVTGEAVAPSDESVSPALRRVLVIEEQRGERDHLSQSLSRAGFEVEQAQSGDQALKKALHKPFSALTLDLLLPDCKGLQVLDEIREGGVNRNAPVVVLTIQGEEAEAASYPICNVLRKPLREQELRAAFAQIGLGTLLVPGERGPSGKRPVVFVIDDEDQALSLMSEALHGMGLRPVCFRDGRDALREIDTLRPDAIVLDLIMPEMDGFAVLDALRDMENWRRTPVFVWTSADLTQADYVRLARSAAASLKKRGMDGGAIVEALQQHMPRSHPQEEKA